MALVSLDHCPATLILPALHSILDNLLRNALTHCPTGSQVEIQLTRLSGRLKIEVVDNGPGMSAEELGHATERFFRGQGAGPGTGLGLAIVNEAARLLGGRVSLAAREGRSGLHVTIEWPEG
jgi:signal transduction histidine kinase